jgi:starvation-inducible outer membrane lipoprotein
MKRIATLTLALALTGCATYTNPVTGEQETYMTQEGADVLSGALAIGAAAALVGATSRYSYSTPYMRTETCSRRGCTTTKYYRRSW